ncbi:MAG TPA: ABC transporter permease, partial [Vicinamibacteria bacterium]|nr:ABC transporter permease [Vicinamibacteria bacterium]
RVRTLSKNPGFAAVALLTLALGIGVCTAMFSVVDAVLIRPLPFREPDRLVWIENSFGGGLSGRTTRADTFNGWREQSRSFEALAAYFAFFDYGRLTLSGAGAPQRLRGVGISDNFLPTLGISLLHGRNFTAEECAWEGPPAVILSHAFWQSAFAGDPAVVGRSITLNNKPTTIVGVLPRTFDFDSIFSPGSEVELITPFPLTTETANWGNTLFGIGRLRPGVSVIQAQAELTVVSERLRQTIKRGGKFGAVVMPIGDALRGKFRGPFLALTGAVACVLAIACVNLSNLLLTRANARRHEFAVRAALGATRRHLIEQALTESLVLAFAGSLIGVPLAAWATRALARLQTFGVPLLQDASVDPLALAVTVGLTTLAGVACGVVPALHLASAHRGHVLQQAGHQRSAGRSSATARNALVVAEVALACVLLVGAGLLFRSFNALLRVELGFAPQSAMSWRLDAPRPFTSPQEGDRYFEGAVQRVAALPGVEGVGLSDCLPLGRNRTWGAGAQGVQYPEGQYPLAYPRIVDHNYLQVMRIPLRAGRFFDERDDARAEKAIIINEHLARRLWPGQDAVGRMMAQNGGSRVVGVVGDVRHGSLEQQGENEMYLDQRQIDDGVGMEMVVRSRRTPESLVPDVRAALAAYDPGLPTGEFYELDRLVDNAVAPRRLITRLLGVFSTLALTLAALGLYGVIAYSVGQRTQEIGIRMAVGAERGDVLKMVLGGGLTLVAIGVLAGLALALALTRVLQSLLFGVTAHDPLVFAGNAALLVVVAALACALPAWRATRVNPVVALRAD